MLVTLASALGEPFNRTLAEGTVAIEALHDRFGALALPAFATLKPGDTSDRVRAIYGFWVARLAARESDVARHATTCSARSAKHGFSTNTIAPSRASAYRSRS